MEHGDRSRGALPDRTHTRRAGIAVRRSEVDHWKHGPDDASMELADGQMFADTGGPYRGRRVPQL